MKISKQQLVITLLSSAVIALLALESRVIFTEVELYYYANSTIVQGFIALVAFLGSFVLFKLQLLENAMQQLTDQVATYVAESQGAAALTYSPSEMMAACGEISSAASMTVSKPIIDKTFVKMSAIHQSKTEIRAMMVQFVFSASLNVTIALVNILFSPVFAELWILGGIMLTSSVAYSIFNLYKAWQMVQATLGQAQETFVLRS